MNIKSIEVNQTCSYCVLDSSFSGLEFNEHGQCYSCIDSIVRKEREWFPNSMGYRSLCEIVEAIKKRGKGQNYDCMIGLSGGIDSAYLAHIAVKVFGLRVLAVHVDSGWNSSAAVSNIESLVRKLDLDLITHVVEWHEMRDLQLAYLKSSVLNQDIPQDHLFFSTLYRIAIKYKIKDFLSGVNYATENINIINWGHPHMDSTNLKSIHRLFGTRQLVNYKTMSLLNFLWISRIQKKLIINKPLNYLRYEKKQALQLLTDEYSWIDYGEKHSESRFTKFYQQYYLPKKFGIDKRKLHLSSLIISGEITRQQALKELEKDHANEVELSRDLKFMAKKLCISVDELQKLIELPCVSHTKYPNDIWLYKLIIFIKKIQHIVYG